MRCILYLPGTISEIDESSAYSWDVCDKCESDKLAEKSTTKYVHRNVM